MHYMSYKLPIIITLLLYISTYEVLSQPMRIVTYNVENLFDIQHDTLKNDTEFLPTATRRWTYGRYQRKIHDIMQVIVGIGEEELPVLVGLCEIENANTLKSLTQYRPYSQLGYDYIHYESADKRGIDVALLYQKDKFTPIASKPIEITLSNGDMGRDALYVCGTLNNGTTLHIFQVHLPSRVGGASNSEPNRIAATQTIKNSVDSIMTTEPNAAIIIMGDFNDSPKDYAPHKILGALPYKTNDVYENSKLYNLAWSSKNRVSGLEGTYFYDGYWDMLDHIIVSGALLNQSLTTSINDGATIFKPDWISKWNKKRGIFVPRRTYLGTYYQGGVSDHYPIYIELFLRTTP